MVTLKEVAARAGVSLGTASAALNGRVTTKAATRERVERVAAELGYRKDASASVLAGKQRRSKVGQKQLTLGYVVSPGEVRIESVWELFATEAGKLGYDVEQVRLRDYRSGQHALDRFRFLNIQGLYLASPGAIPNREWLSFDWHRFSVVKAFLAWPELTFPTIRHSAFGYMRMARDMAIAHGYKKIAVILTRSAVPQDDEARLGSLLGYVQLHPEAALEIEWKMLENPNTALPEDVINWLKMFRPEVVVGFPGALYHRLLDVGFLIPKDFAFVSVTERASYYHRFGVAGCDGRGEVFPKKAVQLLHRMVQVGDRGLMEEPTELVVEPRWLEGASLPGRG